MIHSKPDRNRSKLTVWIVLKLGKKMSLPVATLFAGIGFFFTMYHQMSMKPISSVKCFGANGTFPNFFTARFC